MTLNRSLALLALLLVTAGPAAEALATDVAINAADGERLLAQSRERYARLPYYSDTVTVVTEEGSTNAPPIVERHRVETRYRAPRNFFYQFDEDPKAGAERFAIWCDGGDFNSWWSATRVHDVYGNGRGTLAFALGSQPTHGTTMYVAPLLFPQAQMKGPLTNLRDARLVAIEQGSYRIAANEVSAYNNGNGRAQRKTTLWLDATTLLVRKLVQETPVERASYSVSRITLTFEPDLAPVTDIERFRFKVPAK